jgi:hypothetical protein
MVDVATQMVGPRESGSGSRLKRATPRSTYVRTCEAPPDHRVWPNGYIPNP